MNANLLMFRKRKLDVLSNNCRFEDNEDIWLKLFSTIGTDVELHSGEY